MVRLAGLLSFSRLYCQRLVGAGGQVVAAIPTLAGYGLGTNAGRACTSTVEAGSAARPVPRPRQLADVPWPCLHHRTGLVFVPELRLQRWRRSVRAHFRLHLRAGLRQTNARGRLRLRNDEAIAARVANLRRPHSAVRVL